MATAARRKLEAGLDPKSENATLEQHNEPESSPRTHAQESQSFRRGTNGTSQELSAFQLAHGLAWFSIGLGLAELLAPRAIARFIGVRGRNTSLIQLFGLREIASGIGIFAQESQGQRPSEAVWSRVAGDVMDLAALATSAASPGSRKGRVAFAAFNVLTVTGLDVVCAQQLSTRGTDPARGVGRVIKGVIIDRPAAELYQQWRDFENLPLFMRDLESVTVTGDRRSHWVAKGPAGTQAEWDAELTEDRPNELISWRSIEGSTVDHSGSVRFTPAAGNRGTLVQVEMQYQPAGGVIGLGIAQLLHKEPAQMTEESLRCFKQIVETGEVIVSEGTLWDNGVLSQRPAQPAGA